MITVLIGNLCLATRLEPLESKKGSEDSSVYQKGKKKAEVDDNQGAGKQIFNINSFVYLLKFML